MKSSESNLHLALLEENTHGQTRTQTHTQRYSVAAQELQAAKSIK
jgi:hypothetical protein